MASQILQIHSLLMGEQLCAASMDQRTLLRIPAVLARAE
jgi:hypothetical protein